MDCLIDTNIAIHLRDGDQAIVDRIHTLPAGVFLSIVSQIELEMVSTQSRSMPSSVAMPSMLCSREY